MPLDEEKENNPPMDAASFRILMKGCCPPLLGTILALTGCGGSGESDESPTAPQESTKDAAPATTPARAEFEGISRRLRNSANPYVGRGVLEELRAQRDFAMVSAPVQRVAWHVDLAMENLRQGDVDAAEAAMNEAVDFINGPSGLTFSDVPFAVRAHGIVHLRRAEVENCIQRHNRDCCVFPLAGGGVHEIDAPARRAFQDFQRYLQYEPDDLGARWLLNIASMALGEYPGSVPADLLIPESAFAAELEIPRFLDVAGIQGVDAFNLCGGAVLDDFDDDGHLDIITSTFDLDGPLLYFRGNAELGFADESDLRGTDQQLGGLNCNAADYDNDGDVDVLVLRGAWLFDDGQIRNSLLQNDGNGHFTDVTREAGLAEPAYPTQAAAWGDFNNDGLLDLYIANEARPDDPAGGNFPSQLFQNNGDGTFTDIAPSAGVTNDQYGKGVAAGDFNNDGWLDIYVSNIGPNRLYRNNGDGTFTDVASDLDVVGPERSFATWFFDDDNDGDLDLFVTAYEAPIAAVAADHLDLPYESAHPALYRNEGGTAFRNVTDEAGLDHAWLPMGASFGDLNFDGFPDIYLATGDPNLESLMPNVMLLNDGHGRYLNVSAAGGFGHLQKGHGVVFADYDNDGDTDVYHQLGGFFAGDKFRNALFENPGWGGRFLYLSLRGTWSNHFGLGTRIRVEVETPEGPRTIHHATGCVSSFGARPSRQEIGLGRATSIRRVTIEWPASGTTHTYEDLELNQWYVLQEHYDGALLRLLVPSSD